MYGEVKTLVIFLIGPLRNKLAKVEVERFSMHEVPRIRYVKGSVRMADEPAVILTKKEAETPACSEVKVVEKTSVKKTSVKKTSAKKTSAEKTSAKKNQGPPRSKRKVRVPRKKSEETSVSGNTSIHNGPQLIAKPRSTKAGEGQADGQETEPKNGARDVETIMSPVLHVVIDQWKEAVESKRETQEEAESADSEDSNELEAMIKIPTAVHRTLRSAISAPTTWTQDKNC